MRVLFTRCWRVRKKYYRKTNEVSFSQPDFHHIPKQAFMFCIIHHAKGKFSFVCHSIKYLLNSTSPPSTNSPCAELSTKAVSRRRTSNSIDPSSTAIRSSHLLPSWGRCPTWAYSMAIMWARWALWVLYLLFFFLLQNTASNVVGFLFRMLWIRIYRATPKWCLTCVSACTTRNHSPRICWRPWNDCGRTTACRSVSREATNTSWTIPPNSEWFFLLFNSHYIDVFWMKPLWLVRHKLEYIILRLLFLTF